MFVKDDLIKGHQWIVEGGTVRKSLEGYGKMTPDTVETDKNNNPLHCPT